MSLDAGFVELVQLHERTWGEEQYVGRPTLKQLLTAPIVAVWSGKNEVAADPKRPPYLQRQSLPKESNFLMSVHNTAEELHQVVTDLVLLKKVTPYAMRKLSKVFIHQKEVQIVGVKLILKSDEA